MSTRSWILLVVAALFSVGNLVFTAMVAVQGEAVHAGVHVLLALLGAYGVYRVLRKHRPEVATMAAHAPFTMTPDLTDRLTRLEQSVDGVAVEVERIGEGQRFMTRVFAEKSAENGVATEQSRAAP